MSGTKYYSLFQRYVTVKQCLHLSVSEILCSAWYYIINQELEQMGFCMKKENSMFFCHTTEKNYSERIFMALEVVSQFNNKNPSSYFQNCTKLCIINNYPV